MITLLRIIIKDLKMENLISEDEYNILEKNNFL